MGGKSESSGEIDFAGVHYFQDETKLISDSASSTMSKKSPSNLLPFGRIISVNAASWIQSMSMWPGLMYACRMVRIMDLYQWSTLRLR